MTQIMFIGHILPYDKFFEGNKIVEAYFYKT